MNIPEKFMNDVISTVLEKIARGSQRLAVPYKTGTYGSAGTSIYNTVHDPIKDAGTQYRVEPHPEYNSEFAEKFTVKQQRQGQNYEVSSWKQNEPKEPIKLSDKIKQFDTTRIPGQASAV